MESFNETEYRSKSNRELKEFCKANHIVGITGKNKDGLLSLIKEHFDKKLHERQEINAEIQKAWKDQENPSETDDTYWLYWFGSMNLMNKSDGKWMLFFDRSEIDAEWRKFTTLLDESKLTGVLGMKVSTARENPRASSKNDHVIILYCKGNNEELMQVGNTIVSYLDKYRNPYIYYKSNDQTREGTRATGQQTNHALRVATKKPVLDTSCYRKGGLSRREQKNAEYKEGYCICGRKDVEGESGCSRWPSCVD